MQTITYPYKRQSGLMRRLFNVTVRLWFVDGSDEFVTYEVDAPDAVIAYNLTRKHVDAVTQVNKFIVESIREVIRKRDGSVTLRVMLDPDRGWLKYS